MSGGVLEIPAFVLGVAGLFTSCVDAFSYFKLYQNATRDIEIVLLKLDIEKARLLIWGDNIGIFSATQCNPRLLDERVADLIQRILEQIHHLLTDSDKLRASYGVRILDSPVSNAVNYISSKSLGAFRISASRFLTRNAARLTGFTRGSTAARTKWAIHEREKFQELVINLGHFVDRLFELTCIGPTAQDRIIIEDIESILDISRLDLIEEATQSYPAYSSAARSAKASTEAGTLDRRTFEEQLRDIEELPSPAHTEADPNVDATDSLVREIQMKSACIVLTDQCRKQRSNEPCDLRVLGDQINADQYFQEYPTWNLTSGKKSRRNTLADLLYRALRVQLSVSLLEDSLLGDLLKLGTTFMSEPTLEQQAFMDAQLPIIDVFLYCGPCVCLVHTALALSEGLKSPFVKVHLRLDDRLASSCCRTVERSVGLRSVLDWVWDWESHATTEATNLLAQHLDLVWLERRLEHIDYETRYNYTVADLTRNRVIVLGEVDSLAHMIQRAPGRVPKATEIWEMLSWSQPPLRSFFCRFVESRPKRRQLLPVTEARDKSSSIPNRSDPLAGIRRPASPSSSVSESKRQNAGMEGSSIGNGDGDDGMALEDNLIAA